MSQHLRHLLDSYRSVVNKKPPRTLSITETTARIPQKRFFLNIKYNAHFNCVKALHVPVVTTANPNNGISLQEPIIANRLRRGKMQMTKSRLVLVLHLIGTSFLDQSQSVFKQTHCNPVFDKEVLTLKS